MNQDTEPKEIPEEEESKSFVESPITPEQLKGRLKKEKDWFAMMGRYRLRDPASAQRQEQVIRDIRHSAEKELTKALYEFRDLPGDELKISLKGQVSVIQSNIWHTDVPRHPNYSDFRLSRPEFETAVWEEGWPSLTDRIDKAVRGAIEDFRPVGLRRVAGNLRFLRETCGWSQEDLVEKAGLDSKRRVAEHESARKMPRLKTLSSYARVFSEELGLDPQFTATEIRDADVRQIIDKRRKRASVEPQ